VSFPNSRPHEGELANCAWSPWAEEAVVEMSGYDYSHAQTLEKLRSPREAEQREGLVASLYLTAADEAIDDCCRRMLEAEQPEIQMLAAFAVAARGLLDSVHILASRMTSEDWEARLVYGDCIGALLQRASDGHLLGLATGDSSWLAYMSCIVLARRGTDNHVVYRLLDELAAMPSVRSAMKVPSPEIEERWAKITRTTI